MTTIVFDGKTLAIDSQQSQGSTKAHAQRIAS